MANHLVKITKLEGGEEIEKSLQKWCAVIGLGDTPRVVCSGDALDASNGIEYEEKYVQARGIGCQDCIEIINEYKSFRL